MKIYEKPVVSVDAGMMEGVYMQSGGASGGGVGVSSPEIVENWGTGGQVKYKIDLSRLNLSQLTVVLTFNTNIVNGWGGGAGNSFSENSLTLTWYSAPSTADIIVQINGDVNQLQCTGSSYSNK